MARTADRGASDAALPVFALQLVVLGAKGSGKSTFIASLLALARTEASHRYFNTDVGQGTVNINVRAFKAEGNVFQVHFLDTPSDAGRRRNVLRICARAAVILWLFDCTDATSLEHFEESLEVLNQHNSNVFLVGNRKPGSEAGRGGGSGEGDGDGGGGGDGGQRQNTASVIGAKAFARAHSLVLRVLDVNNEAEVRAFFTELLAGVTRELKTTALADLPARGIFELGKRRPEVQLYDRQDVTTTCDWLDGDQYAAAGGGGGGGNDSLGSIGGGGGSRYSADTSTSSGGHSASVGGGVGSMRISRNTSFDR